MRVLVQVCLVYAFGISGDAARQGHDLEQVFWVLGEFLLSGCDSPPGRLANRRGLFRRGNQGCFVREFCMM